MLDIIDRIRQYEPFFGIWRLDDPPVVLGRGNSGVVFLIHDGDIDAALKVISIPRDQQQLDELYRMHGSEALVNAMIDREYQYAAQEIQIMRKLKGLSNIVCFEDFMEMRRNDGVYGYDVIIRMERLIRLDEFLDRPSRFGYSRNLDMVLKIWTDLVTGLYYCERNGILHLDIKPDNIFYTGTNMNLFKLGDFGVSIRSDNGKGSVGIEVGTPAYMAPEIHHGKGGDVRSDIYSLALVIYELLNNDTLPFMPAHASYHEYGMALNRRFTEAQEIPPIKSLDTRLSKILMRCLRYRPEDRYQTMRELHEDLQQYLVHKPKPSPGPRWLLPALGIGAVGALAVMGYFMFRQPPTPPGPTPEPITEPPYTFSSDGGSTDVTPDVATPIPDHDAPERPAIEGETPYAGTASQTLVVRAEPGSRVSLLAEGKELTYDNASEDGIVHLTHTFEANTTYAITATDAAGNESEEYSFSPRLTQISAVLSEVSEDSESLSMYFEGGTPKLSVNGQSIDAASLDEVAEGEYRYAPEVGFTVGEVYVLVVTGDDGRDASDQKTVSASTLRQIEARLENAGEGDTVQQQVLEFSGTAEDGTSVQLLWNGKSAGNPVSVQEGRFSASLSLEDVDLSEDGGEGNVTVVYANGLAASRASQPISVNWLPEFEPESTPINYTAIKLFVDPGLDVDEEEHYWITGNTNADTEYWLTDVAKDQMVEVTLERNGEVLRSEIVERISSTGEGQIENLLDDLEDGEYTLTARYHDQPEAVYKWYFNVDRTPPAIEIEGPEPYIGVDWTLNVYTEPNIEVALVDGLGNELVPDGSDDNGFASFDYKFEGAEVYYIRAHDAAGNEDSKAIRPKLKTVVAKIEPLYENSWALTFQVDSEYADFSLLRNGEPVADYAPGDGNAYTLRPPEEHFVKGDVYTLEVTDVYGLSTSVETHVKEANFEQIELRVDNRSGEAGPVYRSTLEVRGTAQAREAVQLLWNGEPVGEPIDVTAAGNFNGTLNIGEVSLPPEGGQGTLSAVYSSGMAESKAAEGIEVIWTPDEDVVLVVSPLSEDSEALIIDTDADANIEIHIEGEIEPVKTYAAGKHDGHVKWTPDSGRFVKGEVYIVSAVDDVGNTEERRITVGASSRSAIQLSIDNGFDWAENGVEPLYDQITVIDDTLKLSGTAQPGLTLEIALNGVILAHPSVNDDGSFTSKIGYSTALAQGILPGNMDNRPIEITIVYADGRTPGIVDVQMVVWTPDDGVALNEDDGGLQLYEGGTLVVRTDPYADVTITLDGESHDIGKADESGYLEWPLDVPYHVGSAYTVTVRDAFGHARTSAELRVEELQRKEIVAVVNGLQQFDDDLVVTRHTLTLSIEAEPMTDVVVRINGREFTRNMGSGGSNSLTLLAENCSVASGESAQFEIAYADGHGVSRTKTVGPFIWDWTAALIVEPVVEDSEHIVANAGEAVNAELAQWDKNSGKWVSVDTRYFEDGELRWNIQEMMDATEYDFYPDRGTMLRISVQDRFGNVAEREIEVQPSTRQDIEYDLSDMREGDNGSYVQEDHIRVEGTAEPGQDIVVYIFNEEGDYGWDTVKAEEDGRFECTLDESYLLNETGEHTTLPNRGGIYKIYVYYDDSRHVFPSGEFTWDYRGPDVTVEDATGLDRNWRTISGTTEPKAAIQVLFDGELAGPVFADEEGRFTLDRSKFANSVPNNNFAGVTLELVASDALGNQGVAWSTTFQEEDDYPGDVVILNQEENGSVSGTIQIEGWFAGFDKSDAQLSIENASGSTVATISSSWSLAEMTAEEKAEYLGGSADSFKDSQCQRFTASFDLTSVSAGNCRLVLKQSSFLGVQTIKAVDFTVVKAAGESQSLYINPQDGIAMDADAPERSFQSGDILLTGWCYHGSEADNGTMLRTVTISSVSGAVPDVTLNIGEIAADAASVVSSGKNQYALVARNISAAADMSIRSQMSGVVPSNINAGFMLYLGNLGTTLPNGDYNITISAMAGSNATMLSIGPVQVTIDSSAAPVSSSEAAQKAYAWAPPVVTPAPESTPANVG